MDMDVEVEKRREKRGVGAWLQVGMEVEVRNDEVGLKGSWYEGTIIRCLRQKKRVAVQYRNLIHEENETTPLREVINCSFLRPRPPTVEEPLVLELNQRVDAFYLDGWWVGYIVKKSNAKTTSTSSTTYVVFFPDSNEEIEFERSQMRLHQDWDGVKWVAAASKKDLEGRNSAGDEVVQAGDVAGQVNAAMEISTSPDSRDKAKGNSLESSKRWTSDEHKSLLPQKKSKKEATEGISSPTAFQEATFGGETLRERLRQYHISNSPNTQVQWRVKMLAHRRNPLIYYRAKQQQVGTEGDHKVHKNRKVKKPNKVTKPKEQLGNVGDEQLNEKLHAPQTEPVTPVGLWDKDLQTQGRTSVIRLEKISNESTQNEGDEIIHEEQQKSLHQSSGDHDEQRKVEKANAVDPSCKELSPLPFVKSSPMWKMVESDVVFNTIPQSPHFQPLEQCSEVLREGMAIGQMVAFANVADAICKLHLGDHRSAFENMLKDLAELERHGFNGQPLRARIERLLWLKDSLLQSEDKLVKAEVQIRGQQRQKDYLNTENDALNRDIAILQEKRASVIETRKKTEANIERLRQEVQKVKESSCLAKEDFKRVAAAPWSAFRP
ncbi:DUF724 domain-containing protein 2 [Cinnamomum micranthum f. kanehirae]|uniref:DUF724 domain-containing protein 2 n=1 Tax=Cinnamomum micranthum f. kanehirae TaxID=337451 RepID=A0A3S3P336_9MAGN|nr:DUF724 domain-containing protein 2 [Cinnamomum micranthum f. kanehirae]